MHQVRHLTFANVKNIFHHVHRGPPVAVSLRAHDFTQDSVNTAKVIHSVCRNFHLSSSSGFGKNKRAGVFIPFFEEAINIEDTMAEAGDKPGWMQIDKFRVFPWALSGVESSIVVEAQDFQVPIAFDMGYSHRASVKCQNVFISHGHCDHIAGIASHWSKRTLYGAKAATYYVPPNLVDKLQQAANLLYSIHENSEEELDCPINIKPVDAGDSICLPGKLVVKPFPTVHRVPSQGYIVYRHKSHLKEEYVGMDGRQIAQLVKQKVDVNETEVTPEVAYTGDTTFEVFKSAPNPDLLKVKLLITESTYIDDEIDKLGQNAVMRAEKRGHMHIQQILDNIELFKDVQNILLVHFSDKYSTGYIRKQVEKLIPAEYKEKFHIGLYMKENGL